jgi:hypothetical protein
MGHIHSESDEKDIKTCRTSIGSSKHKTTPNPAFHLRVCWKCCLVISSPDCTLRMQIYLQKNSLNVGVVITFKLWNIE